jgi:hypothetical protein
MYLARAVAPQPGKLDREPLDFFHFTALTYDVNFAFSKSVFHPQEGIENF